MITPRHPKSGIARAVPSANTGKDRALAPNHEEPASAGKLLFVSDPERQIEAFFEYYNNERYHESLGNVTPADVDFGRDKAIIRGRKETKKQTIQNAGRNIKSRLHNQPTG
ncbi:MAG: hypothetical protein D6801_07370 [Alphaproteobacteria bacterium]|nr:MAG: hypothetical protein D6801_07370 [Alphaproteobacteria bacterium]